MKKIAVFAVLLALGSFVSAVCFAVDIIEIKGNKLLSGKIVQENENDIVFVGPDGITQTIPRDQIAMIEKGSASSESIASKTSASSRPTVRSAPSLPAFNLPGVPAETMAKIRKAASEKARARAQSKDILTKINLGIESVYMMQALFFAPDAEALVKTVTDTFAHAQKKQRTSSQTLAALILGIAGFLGLTASGLMVLISSFKCGVRWGLLILTNGVVNFMGARFGEGMVLVSHLWPVLIAYFMITRFRELRKPIIFCMISFILLLSALVLVRIGFVSA